MNSEIPVLVVKGSHYDLGYKTGKAFRGMILKFLDMLCSKEEENIVEYIETDDGQEILNGYLSVVEETYPQYVDEIQGLADGAEIPINLVYVLNLWHALHHYSKRDKFSKSVADHCSGLIINNDSCVIQAHNEDGFEGCHGFGYIIQGHITDETQRGKFWVAEEKFTTFVGWPGKLPGSGFGFNHHGITHTGYSVSPPVLLQNTTPTNFLVRASLAARSFEEIVDIVKDEGQGTSYGFSSCHGNSLQDSNILCNVESAADENAKRSKVEMTVIGPNSDPYFHVNLYKHLNIKGDGKDIWGVTSHYRRKRFHEISPPKTLHDAIDVLSDTQGVDGNAKFTIYNSTTLATAVFDFKQYTMSVYTAKPNTSRPVHVFDLPRKMCSEEARG